MSTPNPLDKLEHDVLASLGNFRVTEKLLNAPNPNVVSALRLLRASIEQLEVAQMLLKNLASKNESKDQMETNQSKVAR